MRIQPKSKDKENLGSRLDRRIKRRIHQTSVKYNVSKSWVVAIILAEFYEIEIPDFQKKS